MRAKIGRLAAATAAVFVYLVLVNAVLFPIVFAEGLAEEFANPRQEPWNLFHLLAFAATAILLTWLVARMSRDRLSLREGAKAGALLGLLVSLPEHLHLYAMVDASALRQFVPVLWILATWGVAGLVVALVLRPGPR